MSEDDFLFVWNCCDELEKARERETVLRVAEKLRQRFQPARPKTESDADPGILMMDPALGSWRREPMPAPESGVGFPPCYVCKTTDSERSPCPICGKVVCEECADGLPRNGTTCCDDQPEERPDLNDSDDWEREP